jgi:hypothetical protein
LPVYPEFVSDRWIDSDLLPKLGGRLDDEAYAVVEERATT